MACWGLVRPQILIWNGSEVELANVCFLCLMFAAGKFLCGLPMGGGLG